MSAHASGRTWDDADGPMVEPSYPDELERRALAILARLDLPARTLAEQSGRRISDELAERTEPPQRAMVDASHDVAGPPGSGWREYAAGWRPFERVEELRATPGELVRGDDGVTRVVAGDGPDERWLAAIRDRDYVSSQTTRPYDEWNDARYDAWLDEQGAVCAAEDLYPGSPDLDDIDLPGQRSAADDYVQEQVHS